MQAITRPSVLAGSRHQQMVRALVGLNLVAYLAFLISANWDTAEHARGAVDSFWYPPHFGIYFSLLAAVLVSVCGVLLILLTPGMVGQKLRHHAALTMLTLANIISFSGAPFDAWWHQVYGVDITVWSPPHLHLLIGSVIVLLSCGVYFLDDLPGNPPLRRLGALNQRQVILAYALGLALLFGGLMFLDYDIPPGVMKSSTSGAALAEIAARPLWSYPLAWTALALFMLALCTASTRIIGMTSIAAGIFTLVRLALMLFDRAVFGFEGMLFYPLVIPALVFDLALALALPRWPGARTWLVVAGAAVPATAALIISAPLYWSLFPVQTNLLVHPWAAYWPAITVVGVLCSLLGWWCGLGLRRLRPQVVEKGEFEGTAPQEKPPTFSLGRGKGGA